jgi:hypothetical protein
VIKHRRKQTIWLARLSVDIFEFWSLIGRGENVHPADRSVFARMNPIKHGFRLDCLPSSFGGRLGDAPVVPLYLSPGFGDQDVNDAQTEEGKDYYVRRWAGYEPIRDIKSNWMLSRTKHFGDYDTVRNKIALLNIGAYHSVDVKSFGSLLALPSSRVSLGWAQDVLFPDAEAGKRVVICMRSACWWGLAQGRKYEGGLFAPQVNRSGYLLKNEANDRLVELVQTSSGNIGIYRGEAVRKTV